jgi:ketosteroid isomerase-like protein
VTRTPKDVVRELVDGYNAKSLDRVLDLYRPDARFWDPFHRDGVVGRERIGEVIQGLFERYPDEQMTITTLVADDTHAVAELESSGTTRSGRPFRVDFTEVYEVRDAHVASCRVYIDTAEVPE